PARHADRDAEFRLERGITAGRMTTFGGHRPVVWCLAGGLALAMACGTSGPGTAGNGAPPASAATSSAVPVLAYDIVRSHPHDPAAFTQGLQLVDGDLYEGTGLHGRSTLRRVELRSGRVLQQAALEPRY